jgi:hypothetical protein
MDDEDRRTAMATLAPLLGRWQIRLEADWAGESAVGDCEVDWALGGQFLRVRTTVPDEQAPDSEALVGLSDDGFVQHYFDDRGIARRYAMTFADGVWTLRRDAPDSTPLLFHQRFVGELSDDGDAIAARWETSPDGERWDLDFHLRYTRVGAKPADG